jgi:hypothetical protein
MRSLYLASSVLLLSLLFLFSRPLFSQSGSGSNGGVTYNYVYQQIGTCPVGSPTGTQQPIYEWDYYDIDVTEGGGVNNANATTAYLVSPGGMYCPPNGPTGTMQIPVTGVGDYKYVTYVAYITAESGGGLSVLVQGSEQDFPSYHLVSILYPPPGNQSWQAYSTGTTTGTSTTVGQTFGNSVEFTVGGSLPIIGGNAGASWGFTNTNGNSETVSTTWSDATGYENDDSNTANGLNPSGSNMINHNWDMFLIWTNPEVVVTGDLGGSPSSFTLTSAPILNYANNEAVVLRVPALYMEANASGNSTVPLTRLEPIEGGPSDSPYFMPGLASICASQTLYQEQLQYDIANPGKANGANGGTKYCTQANQCGCKPADFYPILSMDPLLNINKSTNKPYSTTPTGYAGNTDPRTLDKSGSATCSEGEIPDNSDCRYVALCQDGACSSPYSPIMQGGSPTEWTQSDANTARFTTSASYGEDSSINFGGFLFLPSVKDTWSWTDTESTTNTSTSSNQMQLNLATSDTSCTEAVSIYEDTIFHTYVFSVPDDWKTVCP